MGVPILVGLTKAVAPYVIRLSLRRIVTALGAGAVVEGLERAFSPGKTVASCVEVVPKVDILIPAPGATGNTTKLGAVAKLIFAIIAIITVVGAIYYFFCWKEENERTSNRKKQAASTAIAQPIPRAPKADAYRRTHQIQNMCRAETKKRQHIWKTTKSRNCAKTGKRGCACVPVTLNVFYVNIQSLNPCQRNQEKLTKLRNHIEATQPAIVALVETWLNRRTDVADVTTKLGIENYTLYHYNREESWDIDENTRKGGGFLVAVKTNLLARKGFSFRRTDFMSDTFSQFFTLTKTFNCGVCPRIGRTGYGKGTRMYGFALHYKRPQPFGRNKTKPAENRNSFMEKVNAAFNQLAGSSNTAMSGGVILGDFNLLESKNEWKDYMNRLCHGGNAWTRIPFWNGESTTSRNSPDGVIAFPENLVQNMNLFDVGTVHKGINFELCFGLDFDSNCEICLE